jgi:sulfite reductase alpha subunit-like flavoprotein
MGARRPTHSILAPPGRNVSVSCADSTVFTELKTSRFAPGDIAVIYPSADPVAVNNVLENAGITTADDLFSLVYDQSRHPPFASILQWLT